VYWYPVSRTTRGYDAGKKINGRKRFIITDTLGLLLTVTVCAASVQDRDGAKGALLGLFLTCRGAGWCSPTPASPDGWSCGHASCSTHRSFVGKPADQKGFAVLPAAGR
jgi:hypothetical protein